MSAPKKGARFRNLEPVRHAGLGSLVRWGLTRAPGPWREVHEDPGPPPPPRVDDMRVTLVNHATVLVQCAGLNILTDPVWSMRIGPVSFAGPKRKRPPGLAIDDLPPIDLVLLSHDHYDHLDVPTLARLAPHAPHVLTGIGNRKLVARCGLRAEELDWWDTIDRGGARITFVPAQHFSGRGLTDRDRSLWGGFYVDTAAGSFYFAGDTGWGRLFGDIRRHLGPPRLALLPIGAYRPSWFMSRVHISPAEAVEAHVLLGAATSVAIHYGTFRLADDGMDEPVDALAEAVAEREVDGFWVLPHGEGHDVPASGATGRTAGPGLASGIGRGRSRRSPGG